MNGRKAVYVKRGGLIGKESRSGFGAHIVAMKRRNGRGAKVGQEGGSVKGRQKGTPPATVSARTKQAGEIRGRWSWVEPCVWTERMLTALEKGVRGGKWSSTSTGLSGGGLSTSNTATGPRFDHSIAGSECGYAAFCDGADMGRDGDEAGIISAGPTPSLPSMGCSPSSQPKHRPVSPLGGEPPTGEPCAGEPHARFGGRGGPNQWAFPTPTFFLAASRSS